MSTGDAPITSEWSTILLPTKVHIVLEVWQCIQYFHSQTVDSILHRIITQVWITVKYFYIFSPLCLQCFYGAQEGTCTKCILLKTVHIDNCLLEQLFRETDIYTWEWIIVCSHRQFICSHGQLFIPMDKTYFSIIISQTFDEKPGPLSDMAIKYLKLSFPVDNSLILIDNHSFPWTIILSYGQLDVPGNGQLFVPMDNYSFP